MSKIVKATVAEVMVPTRTSLFGGNSNWRGPIWTPVNLLVIRALWQFYMYYGNDFPVECPTGSGHLMNLFKVALEITNRLKSIFLRDSSGLRPVYGGMQKFQTDPHWKDYILFHEYFHGDNGADLGVSHQTGWTGVMAKLIEIFGNVNAESLLQRGNTNVFNALVTAGGTAVTDRSYHPEAVAPGGKHVF